MLKNRGEIGIYAFANLFSVVPEKEREEKINEIKLRFARTHYRMGNGIKLTCPFMTNPMR